MKASEIMTTPVVSVRSNTPITDAARLLVRHRIAALPVIANDRALVGIVSESDLFRARAVECGFGLGGTVQLKPHQIPQRVLEIMERDVLRVNATDSLELCVALMMRHQGRSLPVLRHGHVVGIISRRDVLGAMTRADPTVRDQSTRHDQATGSVDLRGADRAEAHR